MSDIHVVVSAGEEAAAALADPEIVYADAMGEEAEEALLRVWRGTQVVTEFPAGRYVSWESV